MVEAFVVLGIADIKSQIIVARSARKGEVDFSVRFGEGRVGQFDKVIVAYRRNAERRAPTAVPGSELDLLAVRAENLPRRVAVGIRQQHQVIEAVFYGVINFVVDVHADIVVRAFELSQIYCRGELSAAYDRVVIIFRTVADFDFYACVFKRSVARNHKVDFVAVDCNLRVEIRKLVVILRVNGSEVFFVNRPVALGEHFFDYFGEHAVAERVRVNSVVENKRFVLRNFVQIDEVISELLRNLALNGRNRVAYVFVADTVRITVRERHGADINLHVGVNGFNRVYKVDIRLFEAVFAEEVCGFGVVRADIYDYNVGLDCLNALPLVLFEPGFAVLGVGSDRLSAVAEVYHVVASVEQVLKLRGIAFGVEIVRVRARRNRRAYRRDNLHVLGILSRYGLNLYELVRVPDLYAYIVSAEVFGAGMVNVIVRNLYTLKRSRRDELNPLLVYIEFDFADPVFNRKFDIEPVPLPLFVRGRRRFRRGYVRASVVNGNSYFARGVFEAVARRARVVVLTARIEPDIPLVGRPEHERSFRNIADINRLIFAVEFHRAVAQRIHDIAAVVDRSVIVGHVLPVFRGVEFFVELENPFGLVGFVRLIGGVESEVPVPGLDCDYSVPAVENVVHLKGCTVAVGCVFEQHLEVRSVVN